MILKGYYTDSNSDRVEAGLMYAENFLESYEGELKIEIEISGYCENNLDVFFHISWLVGQVKSGNMD